MEHGPFQGLFPIENGDFPLLCQFARFSRWWFQICFIFTSSWGRFPYGLICFKWVETTNQILTSSGATSTPKFFWRIGRLRIDMGPKAKKLTVSVEAGMGQVQPMSRHVRT